MNTDVFAALADPTRRNIVEILSNNEELPATEIYGYFEVSPQAISQHLKVLREANVVHVEKRAQQRIYRINADALTEMEQWVKNIANRWSRRLIALDSVLKAEAKKQSREDESK
jgi:DNA-binding transcriptional ArsR family regulator